MSIDALRAAQAYAQVAKTAASAPAESLSEAAKPDFGAMVKSAIEDTAASLKAGESAAAEVATGEANLVDVVTAISAAEVSLETALAIRNRVIEAYQEIMRMPI
ncbi:MAG TPA: flagellar hook-basal body complex protein FliE [Parvularculaceae bacterium]|nr:flagellar hook-basal body complex protein FliE [Parvularculaceae bacterium]HNS85532.1 flagellar hook-basal body complex protein FliE [Parvularculaceae bacterium]